MISKVGARPSGPRKVPTPTIISYRIWLTVFVQGLNFAKEKSFLTSSYGGSSRWKGRSQALLDDGCRSAGPLASYKVLADVPLADGSKPLGLLGKSWASLINGFRPRAPGRWAARDRTHLPDESRSAGLLADESARGWNPPSDGPRWSIRL